ncbi:MAG: phosphoribosylformylglycinamidine synthase subunit PurQ [Armatimonadetes bacterium]|nr:phosphoribosylformylglycinamidine synthase subunit PurQ [Armatimonadota bacterium]
MRLGVVRFPGSNCDQDVVWVLETILGQDVAVLWHEAEDLNHMDAVILPGGFSYGDYLRCGAIARGSPVMKALSDFAQRGNPLLGICNGFQILLEAGLLPGVLRQNACRRFLCKDVFVRVERTDTPFTLACREGQVLRIPIAHGEGNFLHHPSELASILKNNQVVFRYCTEDGRVVPEANPNGSLEYIAGLCNTGGNILGMMPHPERCSEAILGGNDGLLIWRSLITWLSIQRKALSNKLEVCS